MCAYLKNQETKFGLQFTWQFWQYVRSKIIIWKIVFYNTKIQFHKHAEEKGDVNPLTLSDEQSIATINKFPCQSVRLAKPFRFFQRQSW